MMKRFSLLCLIFSALAGISHANWPSTAFPLTSTVTSDQSNPQMISDGAGGSIIVWEDQRNGSTNYDIYAQRRDANGSLVSGWGADGTVVCGATANQYAPVIVTDGAGGAIIAWQDSRGASTAIYAQRIDASGNVKWAADGIAVSGASNGINDPWIASDGSGGVLLCWSDYALHTVSAQRLDSGGNALWTAGGVTISNTGTPSEGRIKSDGAGGAVVTWKIYSGGYIYLMQHLGPASGAATWSVNTTVVTSSNQVYGSNLLGDGSGGGVLAWSVYTPLTTGWDVYAQKVDSAGDVKWASGGSAVCTASGNQQDPLLLQGLPGETIICWDTGGAFTSLYVLKLDVNGAVATGWPAGGVAVSNNGKNQWYAGLVSDGAGGAVISFSDGLTAQGQKIDASGNLLWGQAGATICNDAGSRDSGVLAPDGAGDSLMSWVDYRSGNGIVYGARGYNAPPAIVNGQATTAAVLLLFNTGLNSTDAVNKANYSLQCPLGTPVSLSGAVITLNGATNTVTISGLTLTSGTTFSIKATGIKNLSGSVIVDNGVTNVATGTVIPNVAPTISNVQWSTGNSSTLTVTWNTDIPSSSQLNYKNFVEMSTFAWSAESSVTDSALVTNHSVAISASLGSYAYAFQPCSTGGSGQTKGNYLSIPGGFESMYGEYSSHNAYAGSDKRFMFDGWDTSKASIKYLTNCEMLYGLPGGCNGSVFTCTVEYGTTTSYGMQTTAITSSQGFAVRLSGLAAGNTYHYRLRYSNAWGSGAGPDFTTPVVPANYTTIDPSQVLIMANANSPTSLTIANYYAKKRNIPAGNVVTVTGISDYSAYQVDNVVSTGADYLAIKNQLLAALNANGSALKNTVRYIVIAKGLPYRVDSNAIDSYLCDPYGSFSSNPYLQKEYRFSSPVCSGSNTFYLITHLDGPTTEICLAMVDKAVYAEKYGLPASGVAYVDNAGLASSAPWNLVQCQGLFNAFGYKNVYDTNGGLFGQFPSLTYCPNMILYNGNYTGVNADCFAPMVGAVGFHSSSYTANQIRQVNMEQTGAWYTNRMLLQGFTATLGATAEPYLTGYSYNSVFDQAFLQGYTFAEACFMSMPDLNWTQAFFGDPIYRLPQNPQVDTTPPAITNIAASGVTGYTDTQETIYWETDEPADAIVDWGLTSAYGNTTLYDKWMSCRHTETITGLQAGTTYHFRVRSTDPAGNPQASADQTFTTTGAVSPAAPSGLGATSSDSSIILTWTANTETDLQGYKIYRSFAPGTGSKSLIASVGKVTSYTDNGLANGTPYYYMISAFDSLSEGTKSSEATATPAPLSPPANVAAVPGDSIVNLTWDPVLNPLVSGYIISRGTASGVYTTSVTRLGQTTYYRDTGTANSTTYFYAVKTIANSTSANSSEVSVTPSLGLGQPAITATVIYQQGVSPSGTYNGVAGTGTASWDPNTYNWNTGVGYGATYRIGGANDKSKREWLLRFDLGNTYNWGTITGATLALCCSTKSTADTVAARQIIDPDNLGGGFPSGWAICPFYYSTYGGNCIVSGATKAYRRSATLLSDCVYWTNTSTSSVSNNLENSCLAAETGGSQYYSATGWYNHNVTAAVESFRTGSAPNQGWLIYFNNGADLTLNTENNGSTALRPQLKVKYTVQNAGAPNNSNIAASTAMTAATISWTTDLAAKSQVEYGPSSGYGFLTLIDNNLVTTHTVVVTGLSAGSGYHYRVKSDNGSGGLGMSVDATFTTTPAPQTNQVVFDRKPNNYYESDLESEIYKINLDGSNFVRLTNNSAYDYDPSFSADGTRIVFVRADINAYGPYIYIINADGTGEKKVYTAATGTINTPVFSPNGNYMYFRWDDGASTIGLYRINSDGTNLLKLTTGSDWTLALPKPSPNGAKLLYYSAASGNGEVWVMNSDGTRVTNLSNNPAEDRDASWSPDGTRIIFTSNRNGGIQAIYRMNADGANVTLLHSISGETDYYPSYSADGAKIVFLTSPNYFYTMNSDGSNVIQLTNAGGYSTSYLRKPSMAQPQGGDLNPPVLSAVKAVSVTTSAGSIVWNTNKPSNTQAEYGLSASPYDIKTDINTTSVTAHSVALSGLLPATVYHYRVISQDAAGNLTASADNTFTTISTGPVPVINSVMPASATNSNAATFSISGYNFFGGTGSNNVSTVLLNGSTVITLSGYSVLNDSIITGAVLPRGAALGTYDLRIVNGTGISAMTAFTQFILTPPVPRIIDISPGMAVNGGAATLTVNGEGFNAGTGSNSVTCVQLTGTTGTTVTLSSYSVVSYKAMNGVVVPAGTPRGVYHLQISTSAGTSAVSNSNLFIIPPVPAVVSLNPSSGMNSAPTTIYVNGTGFFGGAGSSIVTGVKLGTLSIAFSPASDDSTLPGVVIPGVLRIGTYDISVTTLGGTGVTSAGGKYAVTTTAPLPVVTSLVPPTGSNLGPVTIGINGSNFFGGLGSSTVMAVNLGTMSLVFGAATSDSLIPGVVIPYGIQKGTYDISVTALGGTSLTSIADQYLATTTAPVPAVNSLSVSAGSTYVTVTLNVSGSGFFGSVGSSTVSSAMLGTLSLSYGPASSDSVIPGVVIPPGIALGTYDLTVTALGGTSVTSSSGKYEVFRIVPSVNGLSLNASSNLAPATLNITGSGFFGGIGVNSVNAVNIGPATLYGYSVVSDSSITGAILPAGTPAGTYDLIVTSGGAASQTSSVDKYAISAAAPTVSGLSSAAGSNLSPATITVSGSGFFGGTGSGNVYSVALGPNSISSYSVVNDSSIASVIVPPGLMTGTYDFVVTTGGGSSPTSVSDRYSVTTPLPVLTALSSSIGSGTVTLTVSGVGFFGGIGSSTVSSVKLGTNSLTFGPASSDTALPGVIIPPGIPLGSYYTQVTALGGTSVTSSAGLFTLILGVSGVSPSAITNSSANFISVTGGGFLGGVSSLRLERTSNTVGTPSTTLAASLCNYAITSFSVVSDTLINNILAPSGMTFGTYNARVVSTSNVTSQINSSSVVTVIMLPTVTALSPLTAVNTSSITISTITGTNFAVASYTSGVIVTGIAFDTTSPTVTTVFGGVGTAAITNAIFPAGVRAGIYNVLVSTWSTANAVSSTKFTVSTPAPSVASITPNNGSSSALVTVSVSGTGFFAGSNSADIVSVTLEKASGTLSTIVMSSYSVASDSSISNIIIPAGFEQGSYNLRIKNSTGTMTTALSNTSPVNASTGFMLTSAVSGPAVSAVTPNTGGSTAPATVTIAGSGFFGGTGSPNISALRLVVTSPAIATILLAPSSFTATDDATIVAVIPLGFVANAGTSSSAVTCYAQVTNGGGTNSTSAGGLFYRPAANLLQSVYEVGPGGYPFNTITSAINQMSLDGAYAADMGKPVLVRIHAGTYPETVTLNKTFGVAGGTHPLTIAGALGETAVIDGQNTRPVCITITGAQSFITFSNLSIKNAANGIGLGANATNTTYDSLTITDCLSYGINFSNLFTGGSVVTNCYFKSGALPAWGINTGAKVNTSYTTIINNIFDNTGIQMQATMMVIDGNKLFNQVIPQTASSAGTHLYVTQPTADNYIIRNNMFYNNYPSRSDGIYWSASTATNCAIYNNLFISQSRGPIYSYTNITPFKIYNNTIINGALLNTSTSTNAGSTLLNNIVCYKPVLSNQQLITLTPTSVSNTTINNNCYYIPSGVSGTGGLVSWAGTVYANIASWKASGLGGDTNSIYGDPALVNNNGATPGDYKLTRLSPAKFLGADLSSVFTTDYFGATRDVKWDAGFYESKDAPVVTGVTPVSAAQAAVTTVTITGSGFYGSVGSADVTSVAFDDAGNTQLAIIGALITDTSISGAVVPAGIAGGSYNIKVTTHIGTNSASSQKFGVIGASPVATPVITPASGTYTGAVTITISTATSSATIYYTKDGTTPNGGSTVYSGPFTQSTSATISAVGMLGGMSNSATATSIYTVTALAPVVSGLSVNNGANISPATITVSGYGFFGGAGSSVVSAVKLGTGSLPFSPASSDSTIPGVIIPAGLGLGTYDVTVTTPGGISATTSADKYTVTTPAPTVTALSANNGANTSNVTITVSGSGFFGGVGSNTVSAVMLGTTTLAYSGVSNDSTLPGVVIPSGLSAGTYDVTVTALGGTSATTSADKYTVTSLTPVPVVSGISTNSGSNLVSTSLNITGSGFFGGGSSSIVSGVTLGTTALTAYTASNDSAITGVIIPAGLTIGTYDITVTTSGGISATSSNDRFTVTTTVAAPTISAVTSPTNITTQLLTGTKATIANAIKVNGSATGVSILSSTTWQVSVNLTEGNNSFSVTALDAVGDESAATTTAITLDTIPPAVPVINAVTSPTNVTSQLLTGTKASDAAVIKVNGGTTGVSILSSTTWQASVNLNEGANSFSVTAVDAVGNSSTAATTAILLDTIPPAVPAINAVTSPTNVTTQMLTGTKVTDAAVIKVNGGTTGVSILSSTTWQAAVNLNEGVNNFSVTAVDAVGNESTAATTAITLDTIPPAVLVINAVTSPTNVTTQVLTGTKVTDAAVIKVNGGTTGVSILSSTNWQAAVNLNEGVNNFSVTALDAVGNSSTAATTAITLDTIPPAVPVINAVTSPTNVTTQMLTGTKVTDAAVIKVNGGTTGVSILSSTTWQASVNLSEGNNSFSVTALDAAGNSSTTATTAILLDTIPPSVPIISAVTSPTSITTQLLSGTKATDAASMKVNGSTTGVSIVSSTAWQKTVNLVLGVNNFSVTALDAIGNESAAATTAITVISPVPVISNLSVNTGSNLGATTISITGSGFFGGVNSNTVSSVKLGSQVIPSGPAINDSTITGVVIPLGKAVGVYDITVTALGGISITSASDRFTVTTPAPTVSSLSLTTSSNLTIVTLNVTGSGFFGGINSNTVTAITLGGAGISSFSVTADTAINNVVIPTGIAAGTYDLLVTAAGGTNASSGLQFVVTSSATTVTVSQSSTTTVTVQAADLGHGQIDVEVPAGTFTGTVTLTIKPTASIPAPDRDGLTPCVVGVEITGPVGFTPQQDITINLYYTAAEAAAYEETGFQIGYYDTINNRWVILHSTVYPAERRVEATLRHFTTFAILMMKASANLQNVNLYPNPYNPNNGVFTFANLISDCTISMYTITGIKVKSINVVAGSGITTWDGTNNSGQKVASGVYVVLIKGGGTQRMFKLAVQR